jgi:RNA polymerase sigma factor (sigma-70 family)
VRTEDSRSFTDVVSAEQESLLRLAVLLTGDRVAADDLVQTALGQVYRRRRRIARSGTAPQAVRRALVTTHTSWRHRLSSVEQVVETLPESDPYAEHEEDVEDLRRALRALPPRARAAVVLRCYARQSEKETADLMNCSAGTVVTLTAAALAQLGPGDPHGRLAALAEIDAPPLRAPADLVAAVVGRDRVVRRRQWGLAAVGTVAVLLLVPVVRSWTDPEPPPTGPTPDDATYDVYRPPTRGALAVESDFVDGLEQLPWAFDGYPESDAPPVAERHVVWAAEVNHRRWALVAGPDPTAPVGRERRTTDRAVAGAVALAWFQGPGDRGADEMNLRAIRYGVDPELPAAFMDPESRAVIVVSDPDDDIEISRRPRIEADGTLVRSFAPVADRNGVTVVFADPYASVDLALRYRVERHGAWILGIPDNDGVAGTLPTDVPVGRLRPRPPTAPGDAAVERALSDAFARTGLNDAQVSVTAVWAGDLTMDRGTARLTLLAMEVPSGAVLVTTALGYESPRADGGLAVTTCGSGIRPAGPPVDQQLYVLRCTAGDRPGSGPMAALVVVAPPGSTTARALDDTGAEIARFPLVDGVVVAPLPVGLAAVEVLDAAGTPLDRREPLTSTDLDA